MLSFVMNILLATLAVVMLVKGHFGVTRQMAAVPLGAAVLDTMAMGAVTSSMTPGLSALLVVLQLVILVCAGLVLYQDAARARNKRARRVRRRELEQSRLAFEQALERQAKRPDSPARHRVCA